jgi:hypothetical protein
MPVAVLEDALAALASYLSAGMCRWLELVAELDRRTHSADVRPTAEWLAWRCAIDPRTAREHVRVARRLRELPLIQAAFARGELSYTKVRALTRVAETRFERELLPLAFAMTAAQLERALGAYRRVGTREAREQQEDARLCWYWDEDGSLVLNGRLAPEEGALFLRALEAAKDDLRRDGREGTNGSAEARREGAGGSAEARRVGNADALVAMAERQLATSPAARSGGERYQVVVHVDADALVAAEAAGCQLEDGPALAAETVRRIACDVSLVTSLPTRRCSTRLFAGGRRRRSDLVVVPEHVACESLVTWSLHGARDFRASRGRAEWAEARRRGGRGRRAACMRLRRAARGHRRRGSGSGRSGSARARR